MLLFWELFGVLLWLFFMGGGEGQSGNCKKNKEKRGKIEGYTVLEDCAGLKQKTKFFYVWPVVKSARQIFSGLDV